MSKKNSPDTSHRVGRVGIEKVPRSRNWYLRYSQHGKQTRETTKSRSLKQAKKLARELDARLTLGETPSQATASGFTLARTRDLLIARLREQGRRPKTIEIFQSSCTKLAAFLAAGERTPLDRLDATRLEAYAEYLRGNNEAADGRTVRRPLAPKTVRDHLKNARRLHRFALKRGGLRQDPAAAYELPPKPAAQPRGFDDDVLRDLLDDPEVGDVWRFFLHTGLRASEFVWLTRKDVVFDKDKRPTAIRICRKRCVETGVDWQPKGGRERTVPLTDVAREIVAQQLGLPAVPSGRLFVHQGPGTDNFEPWTTAKLRRRLERRLKACGHTRRKHQSIHAFRHTAATRMANDPAMPIAQVQRMLGHSDLTTTMVYIHPETEDIAANLRHVRFEPEVPPSRQTATPGEETST